MIKNLIKEIKAPLVFLFLSYIILELFFIPTGIPGWPYGHAGDADENIRNAYFLSWGYIPIRDISINHMPGIPEIIYLFSRVGGFLTHKNSVNSWELIREGSFASIVILQFSIIYVSSRVFLEKKLAIFISLILIIYTTNYIFYFLPLSESVIPFLLMLWGSIYLATFERNNKEKKFINSEIVLLSLIINSVVWVGLTNIFSIIFLAFITICPRKNNKFISNLISALIPCFFFFIFYQIRYGINNIIKWNLLANSIQQLSIEKIISNILKNFSGNFHGNILDNLLLPIIILLISISFFNHIKAKGYIELKPERIRFLKIIPSYCIITFICQLLDSWRFVKGAQIYKTEGSWGLLIPLIIYLIFCILDSKSITSNNFDILVKRKISYSISIFLILTITSVFLVGNIYLSSKYFFKINDKNKPIIEGIPKLTTKKDFYEGDQKCGVIDMWDNRSWLQWDAQPCVGVFINSIPDLTTIEPFKSDMQTLIDEGKITIAMGQKQSKKDVWPIYAKQFKDSLSCKAIKNDHFPFICLSKKE